MRFDYGQLTKVWRASAKDTHLTREDLTSVEIGNMMAALLDSSVEMSFRAEGHLVYGISQIWQNKAQLLLQDSKQVDENIGTAFREYLQSLASSSNTVHLERRAADGAAPSDDFLLSDVLSIPQSLLSDDAAGRSHNPADADLSIDAIMRDDDGEAAAEDILDDGENVMRSTEERAVLESLDLGFDTTNNGGDGPGQLDFGSDLPYSSSPPHTPREDAEPDVLINNGSSSPHVHEVAAKQAPPRKRRGAVVDAVITIARPRKAAPRILRPLYQINNNKNNNKDEDEDESDEEEGIEEDEDYIPLDEATEKLLDPEHVQETMRRRRLAEAGMDVDSEGAEVKPDLEDENSMEFGKLDLDDNDIDFGDLSGDDFIDDDEQEEEEDTPDALEAAQLNARDALKKALRRKGDSVEFGSIVSDAKSKASTLMEVLHLAAKGRVQPVQHEAWGPIELIRT